jgi:hypothetical protein
MGLSLFVAVVIELESSSCRVVDAVEKGVTIVVIITGLIIQDKCNIVQKKGVFAGLLSYASIYIHVWKNARSTKYDWSYVSH